MKGAPPMLKFHIYTGAGGQRFVGDKKLGPIVARISVRADAPVNSHARDQRAAKQLHEIGQHTQAEVIEMHARGVPGIGPANPVNRTTHCRRNDGSAYPRWPAGFLLPYWGRGIDVRPDRVDAFCHEARKEGFMVTATYPGSVGEAQHVNFRKPPIVRIVLSRSSKGRRVRKLCRQLMELGYLPKHKIDKVHYNFYGPDVEKAVKKFQREHHQKVDGDAGPHTRRAIAVAVARKTKKS